MHDMSKHRILWLIKIKELQYKNCEKSILEPLIHFSLEDIIFMLANGLTWCAE